MATMASSARDIPKPFGRDSFAAVAARSVPLAKGVPLPTPPNSISPSLPPHGVKAYCTRSTTAQVPLDHVESDLDLQDEADSSIQDGLAEHDIDSPAFDSTGNITSNLLAKHHLPEILLAHGPLAIRYIMGYLTTSVPGFSGIPPTKARRLVVGALEGRGSGGQLGGVNGDVRFQKVGWGRWDAKVKAHASRSGRGHSPPPSNPSSYSINIPSAKVGGYSFDRTRLHAPGSSWAGNSAAFSHDDETAITMLEYEADKMSLDGDASCSSSEAPPDDDEIMGDDPDDLTDEEDWAAVGASALRAASYSGSGLGRNSFSPRADSRGFNGGGGGGPSLSALAKSIPQRALDQPKNFDFSAFGLTSDPQEREAIEALLRLGSV